MVFDGLSPDQVVDVFCEDDGPVRIHMKSPQDGSSRQFDRPRDQELQKTLQRISLTLKRGPKKKRAKRTAGANASQSQMDMANAELAESVESNGLFDDKGEGIDDLLPLADAFASARAPTILNLSGALSCCIHVSLLSSEWKS